MGAFGERLSEKYPLRTDFMIVRPWGMYLTAAFHSAWPLHYAIFGGHSRYKDMRDKKKKLTKTVPSLKS